MRLEEMHKTAAYQMLTEPGGIRFRFFCDLSGAAVCTTHLISAGCPEEALELAWNREGKSHFNQCHRCGRWVSDVMYNPDVLACVECAPWEAEPRFCPHCGEPVVGDEVRCRVCGRVLRYAGGTTHGTHVE